MPRNITAAQPKRDADTTGPSSARLEQRLPANWTNRASLQMAPNPQPHVCCSASARWLQSRVRDDISCSAEDHKFNPWPLGYRTGDRTEDGGEGL